MGGVFGGGGGGGGPSAEQQAQQAEQQRQEREARIRAAVNNINNQFAQFDDNFFNARGQAFRDFAIPQLEDQFRKARENTISQLANAGLSRSSVANQAFADLERQNAEQRARIQAQAQDQANALRQQVANERAALIRQAQNAESPSATADNAANVISSIRAQPSNFSPLGTMFDNFTAGLDALNRSARDREIRDIIGGTRSASDIIGGNVRAGGSGQLIR